MPIRTLAAALLLCLLGAIPATARSATEAAFAGAIAIFEEALPALGSEFAGVSVASYRDALTLRRFSSSYWGGSLDLRVRDATTENSGCERFAAYVEVPPRDGAATLVICPRFHREGNDPLRALTILHEVVHAVAGPNECRAMAFAARVEQLATGGFTDVERYWQANACSSSGIALP